jgi:ribonuclease P protein component
VCRLARTAELERVQRAGRRKRLAHLDVLWADNQAGHPRMGLIVPKFQSTVVARNRLRRRLKELWRRELMGMMPAWDVVIRARKEAYAVGFGTLRDQLRAWHTAVV